MDVLVTGYPSIDTIVRVSHSPLSGETAHVLALPEPPMYGGCGINVAVGLTRLGFNTGAAVVLGEDDEGRTYRAHLESLDINTAQVTMLPDQPTSRSTLYVDPQGRTQTFFLGGAADEWSGALDLRSTAGTTYALVTVGQLDYNRQFVREMRRADIPLVWMMKADVLAYPPDVLREFLDASEYVIMNDVEAEYVLRTIGAASAEDVVQGRCRAMVITRGVDGADVVVSYGTHRVSAVPVAEVMDPTGAGDAFAAGLLAGLLKGASPLASARLGAVVASFVVEAVGCQTNLPDWAAAMARHRAHFGNILGE